MCVRQSCIASMSPVLSDLIVPAFSIFHQRKCPQHLSQMTPDCWRSVKGTGTLHAVIEASCIPFDRPLGLCRDQGQMRTGSCQAQKIINSPIVFFGWIAALMLTIADRRNENLSLILAILCRAWGGLSVFLQPVFFCRCSAQRKLSLCNVCRDRCSSAPMSRVWGGLPKFLARTLL